MSELHAIAQFNPGRVALRSILDIFAGIAKLDATCHQFQRDVVSCLIQLLSESGKLWNS